MTSINGVTIAAKGINVWNPAFDVTPAELITAIITDIGIIRPTIDTTTGKTVCVSTYTVVDIFEHNAYFRVAMYDCCQHAT